MTTSLLRWILVALVVAHGIAHGPGFAVAWRLMSSPEIPYHTTLFGGRVEIGDAGMRVAGLIWLLVGAAFVGGAVLLARNGGTAVRLIVVIALVSLVLCVAEWPYARLGLVLNVAILTLLTFLRL